MAMTCTHQALSGMSFAASVSITCDVCHGILYRNCYTCKNGCDYHLHGQCLTVSQKMSLTCTHRTVSLAELDDSHGFMCDGCQEIGYGSRYQCTNGCDYDLHRKCATASQIAPHHSSRQLQAFPAQEAVHQHHSSKQIRAFPGQEAVHQHHSSKQIQAFPGQEAKIQETALTCTHRIACLVELDDRHLFVCDRCQRTGSGSRYQCANGCNYTLHGECLTASQKIALMCTHQIVSATEFDASVSVTCDGCQKMVYRNCYRCTLGCNYTIHGECLTASQKKALACTHSSVSATEFDDDFSYVCDRCMETGYGSMYQCTNDCDYGLHEECLNASNVAHHDFFEQRTFTLQPKAFPNSTKLCAACGIAVTGWRYHYTPEIGPTIFLHPCCIKMPHCIKTIDGNQLFLKQRLVSVKCGFCERTALEGPIEGWAYMSPDQELACHVRCMKDQKLEYYYKKLEDNWNTRAETEKVKGTETVDRRVVPVGMETVDRRVVPVGRDPLAPIPTQEVHHHHYYHYLPPQQHYNGSAGWNGQYNNHQTQPPAGRRKNQNFWNIASAAITVVKVAAGVSTIVGVCDSL